MNFLRNFSAALVALALLSFAPAASAQTKSVVDVIPCAAGGIGVNLTDVFFYPATTNNHACVATGAQTSFKSGTSTLGTGVTGAILNLNITVCNAFQTPGCSVADFISFPSVPNLHFDLSLIGPGPDTANCSPVFDANQPICGVFVATPPAIVFNSPFLLTAMPTGTAVSLPIFGQVRDGNTIVGTFVGVLAAQFVVKSPLQVKASIVRDGGLETGTYGLTIVITPAASINAGGVTNAASFQGSGVAPGEIVTLFGSNFSPVLSGPQLTIAGGVSNNVAGTFVLFDGVPASLLGSSSGQISAVVPYGVTGQTKVQVVHALQPLLKSYDGAAVVSSPAVTIPVVASAPGIFTATGSGTGQISMTNQDGKLNSSTAPAAKGSTVTFYATGEGQTAPAGVDGKLASGSVLPKPVLPVSVTIGGASAQVAYAGAAPGNVAGLLQVNVVVPSGAASGNAVPVVLTVGTTPSQPGVTMAVQ